MIRLAAGISPWLAALTLLFPGEAARANNLISNHSFEMPNAQTGILADDTTSIPHWASPPQGTFGAGQPTSNFGGIIVAEGFFDFNTAPQHGGWSYNIGQGNSSAGIYQDVPTTPGQEYVLTFWAAGANDVGDDAIDPECNPEVARCNNNGVVTAGPAAGDTRADLDELITVLEAEEALWREQDYEYQEYVFTASSELTRLSFYSPGWEDFSDGVLDPGNPIYQGSITIDNVTLSIPEPSSVLLITLAGLLLAVGRRR